MLDHGRLDVVALGGGTCAWYENPSWKKRVVTTPKQTPGIISTATADLDAYLRTVPGVDFPFTLSQASPGCTPLDPEPSVELVKKFAALNLDPFQSS